MILLLFILAALLGALLLSAAIVVWLGEVAMPLHCALLIVGLFYVAMALVVYYGWLRGAIERLHNRLDVVYKVSAAFDMVYRRVLAFVSQLFKGI